MRLNQEDFLSVASDQSIADQTWWLPWQRLRHAHIPYVLETQLNQQSPAMISQEYQKVQSYPTG